MWKSRRFLVPQSRESGEIEVGAEPPQLSRSRPDGSSREVREMPLDTSSKSSLPLAVLWVAGTLSLDQTLELLKRAPRLHSVDIPETKQYAEAFARYSSFSSRSKN